MPHDDTPRRKLIEVALPLEAINREAAREKSIRHGHPSTLHLWWARRPLAACRAVLFAQLVDDPSAHPDRFPTEEAQDQERQRLFRLIERLVPWEATQDDKVLEEAREEIRRSCGGNLPEVLDPFCGGGSIPLEAQRLGLVAHGSDLNPVAVLITKALIELPARFANRPPIHPREGDGRLAVQSWPGAQGLAEDVRYYGTWMREEAERRIGHLYPEATLPDGRKASVIAWIWARTVTCPNPACRATMPLVRSFWLGKKKGKEAWVRPVVEGSAVRFEIGHGPSGPPIEGTVSRTGATCLVCTTPVPLAHIRAEGKAGRMGAQLMAIVAEGNRERIYLPPNPEHENAADVPRPEGVPETELPKQALGFRVQGYGMTHHADLFTNRQLTALVTFSGDKLLGGPQSGVIAGRRDLVEACSRHPLARALRPGGLVLEALQDVALAYLQKDGDAIPFWRMAQVHADELLDRAKALGVGEVIACRSVTGGGTLPGREIESAGIALPGNRSAFLRRADVPVIARVHQGKTVLDLRTVDPADDGLVAEAARAALHAGET
jgi:putative DNA methylase